MEIKEPPSRGMDSLSEHKDILSGFLSVRPPPADWPTARFRLAQLYRVVFYRWLLAAERLAGCRMIQLFVLFAAHSSPVVMALFLAAFAFGWLPQHILDPSNTCASVTRRKRKNREETNEYWMNIRRIARASVRTRSQS